MDAVLSVSDFTRVEVYSFGECLAPGLEAHQHLPQCQLWLEDCRLWASTNTIRNRLHDRVCCNQVVQSSRTAIELFSIHCSYRYLVCRMYIYGVAQSGSTVSRQRLCATASSHHGGTQNATFTDNWINSSAIFLSWFSNEKLAIRRRSTWSSLSYYSTEWPMLLAPYVLEVAHISFIRSDEMHTEELALIIRLQNPIPDYSSHSLLCIVLVLCFGLWWDD